MPARCPSTRGRCRCAAQRPLPSMMTAMCRGSRLEVDLPRQRLFGRAGRSRRTRRSSSAMACVNNRSNQTPDDTKLLRSDIHGSRVSSALHYKACALERERQTHARRNSPCGGAVRPASRRSRDSRIASRRRGPTGRRRPRPACRRCSGPCGGGSRRRSTRMTSGSVESRAVFDIEREDRAHGRVDRASRRPGTPAKSWRADQPRRPPSASPRGRAAAGRARHSGAGTATRSAR